MSSSYLDAAYPKSNASNHISQYSFPLTAI
jgi:hypothetical protein